MKTFKKIVIVLLVLGFISFTGCKKEDEPKTNERPVNPYAEAVNTDGVPHATNYVIHDDGTVHLIAAPTTQPTTKGSK